MKSLKTIAKQLLFGLLFLGIILLTSCPILPLDVLNNPVDPDAESYQGFYSVDDIDDVLSHMEDGTELTYQRFIVSEVVGAEAYWLQIATDEDFNNIVYDDAGYNQNIIYCNSNLEIDPHYYWRAQVSIVIGGPLGEWTESVLFTLSNLFSGFLPEDGSKKINRRPTFDWDEVVEATSYEVQVADSEEGMKSSTVISTNTNSYIPPDELGNNQIHYWRVRAVDSNWARSAWGEVNTLEISNIFMATFDSQDGSAPSPLSKDVTYGESYGTLATTNRTGYSFGGWWTGTGGTGTQITSSTAVTITANQTLYAKWTASTYKVSFDSVGGTTASPASKTVTYDSIYGTLAITSKDGYGFGGWWTSVGGTGSEITSETLVSLNADQKLYAKWELFAVGGHGPAGGYIFYAKDEVSDGWRYLEAAPYGWYNEKEDPVFQWGGFGITTGATATGIGAGETNTGTIVTELGEGTYAAKIAYDAEVNGYDDWFLPSYDELNLMYENLHYKGNGGFSTNCYWSSSESNSNNACLQGFLNGYLYSYPKYYIYDVRVVRTF